MLSVLFAVLTAAPCDGPLANIGSISIPCQRMVGVDPGRTLCGGVLRVVRAQATEMALLEASAHPGEAEVVKRIDELAPPKTEAQAEMDRQRARQRRIAAAIREWRALSAQAAGPPSPEKDREIFQKNLEGVMAYEHWVSFRSMVGSSPVADPQGSAVLTDAAYEQLRGRFRPTAVEQIFQDWVRGPWSGRSGKNDAVAWTPELQRAFWKVFLATHPIDLNPSLGCPAVTPEVLEVPGAEPGAPRPTPTPFPIPSFATAADALRWADAEVAKADAKGVASPTALLPVITAYQRAVALPGATPALGVDAALKRAEVFLRLSAPRDTVDTLGAVQKADADASGRYPEIFERLAEAFELLSDRENPLTTYRKALQLGPKPEWKTLLEYRAGLAAKGAGKDADAVKHLEEAVKLLPETTTQGIFARSVLARCLPKGDRDRAVALSSAAKAGLAASPKPAALPRTFIPEPPPEQLARYVAETEDLLKR